LKQKTKTNFSHAGNRLASVGQSMIEKKLLSHNNHSIFQFFHCTLEQLKKHRRLRCLALIVFSRAVAVPPTVIKFDSNLPHAAVLALIDNRQTIDNGDAFCGQSMPFLSFLRNRSCAHLRQKNYAAAIKTGQEKGVLQVCYRNFHTPRFITY
jgi:hypothetical protein